MKETLYVSLSAVLFCAASVCNAALPADNQTKIAPQGVTNIVARFGRTQVSAKVTTHEVDIGKPSDPWPEKKLSSCTYSRFPCSLVDYMEISVDGNTLFVARSVYADLADLSVAGLRQQKKEQFVLTLGGGDASESYTVEITFDKNQVEQRTLASNEAKQVMQKTVYFASPAMDK